MTTRTLVYRRDTHGPTAEEESGNPWLREPKGITEEILYQDAQRQLEDQARTRLLAQHRDGDCDPPTALWQTIARCYAADGQKPPSADLLARVAAAADRTIRREWERIADEIEAAYKARLHSGVE